MENMEEDLINANLFKHEQFIILAVEATYIKNQFYMVDFVFIDDTQTKLYIFNIIKLEL